MTAAESGLLDREYGRVLAWQVSGPLDRPALLWLHGSTGSRRTAPVSSDARVIAYDRPGFGASSPHPARDLRSDVEDVCALLDAFSISRIPVLAFSGGAAVGYALAAWAPERIATLNLVSGAVWPSAPVPPEAALKHAGESLHADPRGAVDGMIANAPPHDRQVLQDPAIYARLLTGAQDAVVQGAAAWVTEARVIRSDWGFSTFAVHCPVRMWHCALDDAVPFDAASDTADALSAATLTRIPDAGHLGWMATEGGIVAASVADHAEIHGRRRAPRRN